MADHKEMNVDYIIPVYMPDKYRRKNLENTVKWLETQSYCAVNIIIEVQEKGILNKPWLCNKGVRKAKSDHLFIGDLDVLSTDNTFLSYSVLGNIEYRKWFFPWNRVKYMNKDGSVKRWWYPYPYGNEGCIVYFTRQLWEDIGGANEFIWQLRGPDNDLAIRAYYETGYYITKPNTLIHQYHPPSSMKNGKHKKVNQGILEYTAKNPERVNKLLRNFEWGGERPYSEGMSFFEARSKYGL